MERIPSPTRRLPSRSEEDNEVPMYLTCTCYYHYLLLLLYVVVVYFICFSTTMYVSHYVFMYIYTAIPGGGDNSATFG